MSAQQHSRFSKNRLTSALYTIKEKSATAFKTRPNWAHVYDFTPAHDLPALPSELLIMIFREAAATPSVSLLDPLSFLYSAPHQKDAHMASMQVKLSIAMVSKAWNRLMQDVLYEFIWIRRASQAKSLARTLLTQEFVDGKQQTSGRFIRRLHMETSVYERCAPIDIRTILDYSPNLFIYSDHKSVQQNRYESYPPPRCSSLELFGAVLSRPGGKLRRLSWTSYDNDPLPKQLPPMMMLQQMASHLEYLELSCAALTPDSLSLDTPAVITPASVRVVLPALRALKVVLNNVTFGTISTWSLPALTNLSVVSSDYSYAGKGFAAFFRAHGSSLLQLELGHSTSLIEEHYLRTPPTNPTPLIPLAEYCPHLLEFICSADAEWNWRTPDWIAPHILLPAHPTLRMIGIRAIDKRMRDDTLNMAAIHDHPWDDAPFFPLLEQISSLLRTEAFPALRFIRDLSCESSRMRKHNPEERTLKFWEKVLSRCRTRGNVWLEDYEGWNITLRDLQRARMV